MTELTIYTATFNRENLLPRLYDSLCRQTCKKFVWLVIDDGSTDKTKELVCKWKNESFFEINYVFKENGGVHTARDLAYEIIDAELIWGVDSDDWLYDDAVEKVLDLWENIGSIEYYGIFAPVKDAAGIVPSIVYPNRESISYQDLFYKYGARGDQTIIIRSDVIKKLKKFPVYKNEKLVPESFKWIQLPPQKKFLILKSCTTYIEYQEDGYTKKNKALFFRNIRGRRATYKQCMVDCIYIKYKFKFFLKYILTSFLLLCRTIFLSCK